MRAISTLAVAIILGLTALGSLGALAAGGPEKPRHVTYTTTPPAPAGQSKAEADKKSAGCMSCHEKTDEPSMHRSGSVNLGCVDCHGGDVAVTRPANGAPSDTAYREAMDAAHLLPTLPETWNYPSSANPPGAYALLNRESPEYVRFVNPSDYRVVDEACGACHAREIRAAKSSIMATGAMLWGGA